MNKTPDPEVTKLTRQLQAAKDALARETIARELAEEKLREVEARSKLGADLARLGGWRLDPAMSVLESSDTCNANFGLSADEDLSFSRFFELIHPDDRDYVRDAIQNALETRTEYQAEYRVVWPDGSVHWIIASGHPFYAADGAPTSMVGVTQNVTERKHAGERLRNSEQRFRRYFELGLIGMAITAPDKGCLEVNDKLCEILGYERGELLRMNWAELTHPDDLATDVAQFDRVIAGEIDGYSMDKRWIRKDGEIVDTTISVSCVRCAGGAVDYFVALLQDITERKRAEEERERFAFLAQNSSEFIGMCDLQLMPFFCNNAGVNTVGLDSLDEALSTPVIDFFFPEDRTFIREEFFPMVLREGSGETEIRFRNFKTGDAIWVVYSVLTLKDAQGEPAGFATISRNITTRKRAQEGLKEREKMFRVLTDAVPDFMWITDAEGRCEFLNQRWFDYTGMTREQSVDLCWRSPQHPDDADRYFAAWQQAREADRELEAELRYRRADGVYRWFLCRALPYRDDAGVITKWYGTTIDIHDKKMAEETLRLARDELEQRVMERTRQLQASNEELTKEVDERRRVEAELRRSEANLAEGQRLSHTGSWAWDVNTGEIVWSEEKFRIFGLDPAQGLPTYAALLASIHPDDRPLLLATFDKAVREIDDYDLHFRIVRPGGEIKEIHAMGHPVFNDAGELAEYVGTIIDTTERRHAEEALRKTQAKLAHVTRVLSLGELTSSIAHEINQPLAAIVINGHSCVRWLDADPPNPGRARETLNRIIRDGNRAAEIIRRIRTLLKTNDTEKVWFDINAVIHEVIALARGELRKAGVSFDTDLTDTPLVQGARIELQQVMLNLIMNAIEAMNDLSGRERKLLIRSAPHALDDGPGVLVALRDTGRGVMEEDTQRLFDAFHTTKPGGLGMGLSISRSIVEAHGGRLWVTANTGSGATFQFVLPGAPPA